MINNNGGQMITINRATFKEQLDKDDKDTGVVYFLAITCDNSKKLHQMQVLKHPYDRNTTFEELNDQWEFVSYSASIPRFNEKK